jgi:hypothetical protein
VERKPVIELDQPFDTEANTKTVVGAENSGTTSTLIDRNLRVT